MGEQTVPILPCRDLRPVLDFYTALGFEVTFRQLSPNPYAAVRRGGVQLHFFAMRRYEPAESYSTCLVRTDDIDVLHQEFRAGLKEAYGRIPARGLPRIGALRTASHGVRQFLMTDPGGNCVRVAQGLGGDQHHRPAPEGTFARALHHAALFADSREDPAAAARVIDRAFAAAEEEPTPVQALRLLVLRADAARRLGDERTAADCLTRARAVGLSGAAREEVYDALRRLGELLEE